MLKDPKYFKNGEEVSGDICIVGAGVAGITFAREFLNTKLKVILLESGGLEPDDETQALNTGRNVGLPYYKLNETGARAFGGTSHLWHVQLPGQKEGIRLRGLDNIDFEKRDWVPHSGWPFEKKELDPYYDRAHEVFKIGPYEYDSGYWIDSGTFPEISFHGQDIKTTIFQFGRKEVFYKDYKKELESADNINVFLNSTVLNVRLSDYANTTERVLVTAMDGKKFSVKAKYFILALSGLQTPRLMLLSNDKMNFGIGNQNDLVGRFFMEHPHLWSGVYYPSDPEVFRHRSLYDIHLHKNVPIMGKLTLSEKTLRREKLLNFTTSIHPVAMAALEKPEKSFRQILSSLRRFRLGDDFNRNISLLVKNLDVVSYAGLRKMMRGSKNEWYKQKYRYYGYKLNIMAEQAPDPESRVMLNHSLDRFGQNQIDLNWKLNASDINSIRRSLAILDRELRRSNLGRLDLEMELEDDSIPENIHGGWHHMGTTRMNNDPKQGVVDENCKVHGINNLFVAGSSVFPTAGYANPTLTLSALSIRLADHIKNKQSELSLGSNGSVEIMHRKTL